MPKPEGDEGPAGHDLFSAAPLPVAVLDDAQRLACLRLIRSENVGPATFRALINHFGGATRALEALPELGRKARGGRAIRVCPAPVAEAELEALARAGAQALFTIEPGYPQPLAFLEGAPPMLYAKGRIELLGRNVVAVVGSRQASAAGQQMARQIATGLGAGGLVVASGLARGIDSAVHHASLATGTVAVLAGGLDINYPPENRALQQQIAVEGCLVSEQPLGFQPRAQDFPRRNRIISGISQAVVVVEAARRSGSLITARLAAEQGREVFAVPGHPLDPRAEGTNQLLKDGANIATEAADVIAALEGQRAGRYSYRPDEGGRERPTQSGAGGGLAETMAADRLPQHPAGTAATNIPSGDDALALVTAALGPAPVEVDELTRATGLTASTVQIALIELSIAGRIEMHGGHRVSLLP